MGQKGAVTAAPFCWNVTGCHAPGGAILFESLHQSQYEHKPKMKNNKKLHLLPVHRSEQPCKAESSLIGTRVLTRQLSRRQALRSLASAGSLPFAILLSGARAAEAPLPGKAFFSLTRTGFTRYMRDATLRFGEQTETSTDTVIRADDRSFLLGPNSGKSGNNTDFVSSDAPWGALHVIELPAGTFVSRWGVRFGGQDPRDISIRFTVSSGVLTYVGNFNAHFIFGNASRQTFSDLQARDIPLLFKMHPELENLPLRRAPVGLEA
jgi:hypothetical protein